jgi:hypothetical protein
MKRVERDLWTGALMVKMVLTVGEILANSIGD